MPDMVCAATQVAQDLLTTALQRPMERLTRRQLDQLLMSAEELGATPTDSQMQQLETFYGANPE